MTQWVKDNRSTWNITGVLQEGDIVNNNNAAVPTSGDQTSAQQWQNARNAFQTLDGQVPYILSTGNHDYGTTSAQNRETQFNNYFQSTDNPLVDPAQGGILKGVMEPNRLDNAYYEFTAPDGREMLIVSLEWGPRQAVVDWANQVVGQSKYDDHTAVLLTHAYMYHDETRYDWARNQDSDPDNNQGGNPYSYPTGSDTNDGEDLWEELVKLHGNFEFVFSGHVGGDGLGSLQSVSDQGNLVHQLLFNSQFETKGGNGWMRVLEFLDDGQSVRVSTFSPYYGLQRTDPANQFVLQISSLPTSSADFDQDGDVDSKDFLDWQKGLPGNPLSPDSLASWKLQFGQTSQAARATSHPVPEFGSVGLLLIGSVCANFLIREQSIAKNVA